MSALCLDASILHHHDLIRAGDGGQAVGNDDDRLTLHQFCHCPLDHCFILRINVGGGLVQNHHRGVFQHGPGDSDTLPLSSGEMGASAAHPGVIAMLQLADEAVASGGSLIRAMNFMSVLPQLSYKIDQMEALFNIPPLKEGKTDFNGNDLQIRFENVRFSYEKDEVLHGISFSVPQGSLTALVGESGSGKSTLAKLLVHFYDVTDGHITLGGQDLREMSLASLNEQISFVAQEQFLFNTSLLENIRLGRPGATDEEVLAAAERAQCGEFLKRLEKGIYTMAGDGGKGLSGGERQRIALARAILKDAPIVVLDEATAFLDPENEEKMNAAIAEVIRGKTVIVIAHRLQSIAGADQIVVLDQGNVAGIGRHDTLRKTCPAYEKLWRAAEGAAAWRVSAEKGGDEA